MATASELFHREGSIDLLDYLGLPLYGLAVVSLTGIGTFSIYGMDMTTVLASGSGWQITYAWAIAALLLGLGWVTNRAGDSFEDLSEFETGAVVLGGIVLVGIGFIPAIRDVVINSDLYGTAALVVLSGIYTVIGYY